MGSTFNPQILVDKLSKLNSSQQSIETLSHWCIFHMNKAKQVVETWDRQFHTAPREQRLAFLYLANDILQNSRRKGAEFVAEFWKVLPDALRDVMKNGDELAKGSALRLINIWEERKVFGSRGQILKEEFGKRRLDNDNRNRKLAEPKPQPPTSGNSFEKLVSGYDAVYSSQSDEDAIFNKCRNAISFVEKVDKDVEGGCQLVGVGVQVKEQHAVLRECIEQLGVIESARANFVSLLRDTLQEQVYKLDQVRDLVQAVQMHSVQADSICRQLGVGGQSRNVTGGEQITTSVTYTRQAPLAEEDHKSAAAAMAAKLTASSSSAQMLTYVLSSLASEGVIGKESSNEYPSEKRAKLENEHPPPPYIPQSSNNEASPPPPPPPPPPSSPPPLPPMPPPVHSYPYMPMISGSYTYSPTLQPPAGPPATPPSNAYQSYQPEAGGGGSFYGQPSSLSMSRQ